MVEQAAKVEVAIEELKDSAPTADRVSVVLETEASVNGELRSTTIEVREEDAPAIAVALLSAEGSDPSGTAERGPAIKCLGAGVVHWVSERSLRIHLQFESGQVLPIEMTKDAAVALSRGLLAYAGKDEPAA